MQITFSERELEDFLCTGKNLEKYLGLKFIARQVRIPPAGIIDILAYHKESKSWVIIELKKDVISDLAILQGLAYLNYYNTTSSHIRYKQFRRKRKFSLLLVGNSLDNNSNFLDKILNIKNDEYCEGVIYYSLFNLSLDNGIVFSYIDGEQEYYFDKLGTIRWDKIEERLMKIQKQPISF